MALVTVVLLRDEAASPTLVKGSMLVALVTMALLLNEAPCPTFIKGSSVGVIGHSGAVTL